MTVKELVIKKQKEIIDHLIACEESISKLYAIYSETIPAHQDFFHKMSNKENTHAGLLRTMHKQLDKGNIFQNIGRFSPEAIRGFVQNVKDAIHRAEQHAVSAKEAMETALSIESSFVDSHFYDVVKSDAPEFRIIAERLSKDTQDHVQLVGKEYQKTIQAG